MKLFKLAWDLIGSDHASRAMSYEKLFVGPAFAVRNYNFINAPGTNFIRSRRFHGDLRHAGREQRRPASRA